MKKVYWVLVGNAAKFLAKQVKRTGRPCVARCFAGLLFAASIFICYPATINVPRDYSTIQAAINAASASAGDTVVVSNGTYLENLDFKGKAITVTSLNGPGVTILDGMRAGAVVNFSNGEGPGSVIKGFTIQNGNSPFGAISLATPLLGTSPTIVGNIFQNNVGEIGYFGAAIGGSGASPVIERNLFQNNTADTQLGAGVVTFVNGSSPIIVDNLFVNNHCLAINLQPCCGATPLVINNTIVNNPQGISSVNLGILCNNILFDNALGVGIPGAIWQNNLVYGGQTLYALQDLTGTNGNISADPMFSNVSSGDFHLLAGSPCIDAGTNGAPDLPCVDFDGNRRILVGKANGPAVVDMGAFEFDLYPYNTNRPVVAILTPLDNSSVTASSNVSIAVSTSEPNPSIQTLSIFDLEAGTNMLLASVASSTYSFLWTNAPIGTNQLTAVAVDCLGQSLTSTVVRVIVTNPAPVPVLGVTLISPPNSLAFCYGNNIVVAALVTNNQPVVAVDFYAGNTLLGSAISVPYQFSWASPQVGIYTLSARVRDTQGNTAASTPVSITVSPECNPIAIVRPVPDQEIDALQSYLLEMGLGSQVFDQGGLSTNLLSGFKLVIWDDVGVVSNGLAANTVDVLDGAYKSGVPLYLIGEHLVSAGANLPQSQQTKWIELTHLYAVTVDVGNGNIIILNPEGPSNPILWGQFADVGDFAYPPRIEMATNDSASALYGQSAGASVLVAYPPITSPGPTPTVVQDFRVLPPDDPGATNVLAGLFKNSVCWLTGCGHCQDASLALVGAQTNDVAQSGQAFSYTLIATSSGECPPLGVQVTNSLPVGFLFLGATNEQGSWMYDSVHRQLVFFIGLMPQDGAVNLGVLVAPMQAGMFTNEALIRLSLSPTNEVLRPIDPPLVTTVVPVTNAVPGLLSMRLLNPTGVQLTLSGQPGLVYGIESSVDLLHWNLVTPAFGPAWTQTFLPWPGTNAPVQFYRALAPQ